MGLVALKSQSPRNTSRMGFRIKQPK